MAGIDDIHYHHQGKNLQVQINAELVLWDAIFKQFADTRYDFRNGHHVIYRE